MPIYLIRHASAGSRALGADSADLERPLDRKGVRQAAALADRLAESGIVHIVSSPAVRCIESVRPLADRLGLSIDISEALIEEQDIETSWPVVEWAAAQDEPVALCSHGDVIPDVIRRAQLRGMVIPTKVGWAKGSVWEMEFDDGGRPALGRYLTSG